MPQRYYLFKHLSQNDNQNDYQIDEMPISDIYKKEVAARFDEEEKITTHVGRHTYGYLFIAAGGQVEVLQKIMGHSDIKTTMIYTHIDNAQIRNGVALIDTLLTTTLI